MWFSTVYVDHFLPCLLSVHALGISSYAAIWPQWQIRRHLQAHAPITHSIIFPISLSTVQHVGRLHNISSRRLTCTWDDVSRHRGQALWTSNTDNEGIIKKQMAVCLFSFCGMLGHCPSLLTFWSSCNVCVESRPGPAMLGPYSIAVSVMLSL